MRTGIALAAGRLGVRIPDKSFAAWHLGVSTLGVLIALGVTTAAQAPLEFEVASIKRNTSAQLGSPLQAVPPGEVREINIPMRNLILRAYPLQGLPIQVLGLPGWAEVEGERFDVLAKGKADATPEERQQMWRALFAERMKLAAHYETREQPAWNLVFARTEHVLGPNIKPSTLDCSEAPAPPAKSPEEALRRLQENASRRCIPFVTGDTISSGGSTLEALIRLMVPAAGRAIADKTGLTGRFEYSFRFQRFPPRAGQPPAPDDAPTIFTALPEQLGLKLEGSTVQAQILVVDHIERPTEN